MQPFYFIPRDRSFFFFLYPLLVLRYRVFAFFVDVGLLGNYQSGSSDRKYPALRSEHLSLSPSRSKTHTHTHTHTYRFHIQSRSVYSRLHPPPLPFFSLSLSFRFRLFGFGPSRHPGLLRSLTNLFDKSFRLIGRTTRPLSFFLSVKFTVVVTGIISFSLLRSSLFTSFDLFFQPLPTMQLSVPILLWHIGAYLRFLLRNVISEIRRTTDLQVTGRG